jgi:hypothetical protein
MRHVADSSRFCASREESESRAMKGNKSNTSFPFNWNLSGPLPQVFPVVVYSLPFRAAGIPC